jgi:hypothetical protein
MKKQPPFLCKGREAEYQKEYREANKEHLKAVAAARYAADPGPALARAKKRAEEKHEEYLKYQRDYHAAHAKPRKLPMTVEEKREYKRIWAAMWRAANLVLALEKERVIKSRRRAKKAGNGGSHTVAQWRMLCEAWEWSCVYCGCFITERSAHQDHRVPIARGGSDDISNIAVSCKNCNMRKHTLTDVEFLAKLARAA